MLEGRRVDFEEEEHWWPYEYSDESGHDWSSPFSVLVLTVEKETLGVGTVVGMIGDASDGMPVIELNDPNAPEGKVQILGSECFWTPINDELTDLAAKDITQNTRTSPYEYARQLDDNLLTSLN